MNDKEKLKEIDWIIKIALQTNELTLEKETRKRYDALLEIRKILRRDKNE